MDTPGECKDTADRPVGQPGELRPGQSGEGARSALEQMLQQEQKRRAQRPRELPPGEPDAA